MPAGHRVPVTELADREVYAADGVYVGRVVDLVLDPETGGPPALALEDVNEDAVGALPDDAAGVRVPYRDVRGVDDAVVLSTRTRRANVPDADQRTGRGRDEDLVP